MSDQKEEERNLIEQFILPYFHMERRFPLMPGKRDKTAEAKLLGLTENELELGRKNSTNNAKQAALELLKEETITELIEKLPFDGTETIVGFGDSTTEDDQGWFQILKEVLEIAVDNARFNFVNAGISGNTTSEALRRLDRDVILHEPDWVIVNLGIYDIQRLNITPNRTLLPLSETWENLNSIQDVLTEYVSNEIVWITPSTIIQDLVEAHLLSEFTMQEKDASQLIEIVSGKKGIVIDPQSKRMGDGPDAWNFLTDGINHSLSGHINTTRELLKSFANLKG
jgi:hypothetical protein